MKQCLNNCDAKPGYYMDQSRTCISAKACTERTSGARYLYQDDQGNDRACVDVESCKDYGYLYKDGNEIKCLTPIQCSEEASPHYAYEATRECSSVAPSTDGGFDATKATDHVYACAYDSSTY